MSIQRQISHGDYLYVKTNEDGRPVCTFSPADDPGYSIMKEAGELIFRFPYGTELRRVTGTIPNPKKPEETLEVFIPQKVNIETGELVDDNG